MAGNPMSSWIEKPRPTERRKAPARTPNKEIQETNMKRIDAL